MFFAHQKQLSLLFTMVSIMMSQPFIEIIWLLTESWKSKLALALCLWGGQLPPQLFIINIST